MRLAPDDVLGDDRYLLIAPCGGDDRAGLEFWYAKDIRHDRDVALTALLGAPATNQQALDAARYAGTVAHPALAGVIDRSGPAADIGGLVVADWTPGTDIGDAVVGTRLPTGTACRLLRPLIEAVDAAHHVGVVIGIDSPGRVRIGERGTAVAAFRGTAPETTSRDDVRGLGVLLYLLLTGAWPTTTPAGELVTPVALRPDVPRDLAMVAELSMGWGLGPDVRTCGPLLRAINEALAAESITQPISDRPLTAQPPPVPAPQAVQRPAPREPVARTRPPAAPKPVVASRWRGAVVNRRVGAVAAALVIVLAVLIGMQVNGTFGVASPSAPTPATSRRPVPTTEPFTTTTAPPTTTTTPPPPPAPVRPATAHEYVVSGSEDNPGGLNNVLDSDPGTVWKTDQYRQQFPSFSPGIGLLVGFGHSLRLSSVTVTSPSPGTVVQIRSAASPGVSLDSSTVLATATLHGGATAIPLRAHPTSPYLLVWITKLSSTGGGFQSEIGGIMVRPMP